MSKKGIPQVVQNVHALIRLAQSKSDWHGPILKELTQVSKKTLAKKWAEVSSQQNGRGESVEHSTGATTEELEKERQLRKALEKEVSELKETLEKQTQTMRQLEQENDQLKKELEALKGRSGEKKGGEELSVQLEMEKQRAQNLQEQFQTMQRKYEDEKKDKKTLKQSLRASLNFNLLAEEDDAPETNEPTAIFTLQEFVWKLLSSSMDIDFQAAVEQLTPMLQSEIGRRNFIEVLRNDMHKVRK